MVSIYPNLIGAIAKSGVAKAKIAGTLGISPRTLYSKLMGNTEFTLSEANKIHSAFFPNMDKDELFRRADKAKDSA